MGVGSWDNLPHYSVIGTASCFYVWINEDGHGKASHWLKGKHNFRLFHDLKKLSAKDKKAFCAKVKEVYEAHN